MEREFNFTKSGIELLPVPSARTRYQDTKIRGLVLTVNPGGSKVFFLYRKVAGKPVEVKIGAFPDCTVDQARKKAEDLNASLNRGDDVRATARRVRGMSFGELFEWWYDFYAKQRRKNHERDRWVFEKYLGSIAHMEVKAIQKADLRQLHAELGDKHGHRTSNLALAMVRAIYNQAIRHDLHTGQNPTVGVQMFVCHSRERRLMPWEIKAFFAAVDADESQDLIDYVYMSLYSAARQGNVLEMRWEHLDLDNRLWLIPMTKNGKPQLNTLHEKEIAILRRRTRNGSPWVFPAHGLGIKNASAYHMARPQRGWKRIIERAGIKDLTPHDLRRSLGSWMVDTGASLPVIGKALGHQTQEATAIYARLSLDPVREAKERAIGALLEAAKNQ